MRPLVLAALLLALALGACGKKGSPEAPAGADPARSDVDMQKDRKN